MMRPDVDRRGGCYRGSKSLTAGGEPVARCRGRVSCLRVGGTDVPTPLQLERERRNAPVLVTDKRTQAAPEELNISQRGEQRGH